MVWGRVLYDGANVTLLSLLISLKAKQVPPNVMYASIPSEAGAGIHPPGKPLFFTLRQQMFISITYQC